MKDCLASASLSLPRIERQIIPHRVAGQRTQRASRLGQSPTTSLLGDIPPRGQRRRVPARLPVGDREAKAGKGEGEMSSSSSASAVPPEDDVCSVCHDRFRIPCQANCSHWFCGKSLFLFRPAPRPFPPLEDLLFSYISIRLRREKFSRFARLRRTASYSVENGFGGFLCVCDRTEGSDSIGSGCR